MASQVVSVQPGKHRSAGYKTGAWNSALCGCCEDMSTCCFGLWCPWCLSCQTSSDFGESLCLPLVEIGGCVPVIGLAMRTAMRERYHIQGSMCDDCVVVAFCNWCSWCQMHRELKIRKQQQAGSTARHNNSFLQHYIGYTSVTTATRMLEAGLPPVL